MHATIAGLHVYPVKSCRGTATADVVVRDEGFALRRGARSIADRGFMVVDAADGFLTQREHPRLALVDVLADDARLTLRFPDGRSVDVDHDVPGPARDVVVWRSTVRAFDAGDAAAGAFSEWLGRECRLVRFDPSRPRACNPDFAGDAGAHTQFADGYPVLVIGEASLADLDARLVARGEAPLPMERFRPNLVLADLPPYEEDHLDTIEAGKVVLKLVKPCVRCQITATDQHTAVVGTEPLPTLASYRYREAFAGVAFGMNAVVIAGAGATLAVGDTVTASHRF